jgi:NAD(P)-dependent dehydrogenase (short-subunit alcohol dehydrogenase family)
LDAALMEDISFEGQVAIVTGAGRGLGRAYAHELAARGAAVVVNDMAGVDTGGAPRADVVVAEIEAAGGRAATSYDSVATAEGGQAVVDVALERFGCVDVVVNNAGFLRSANFEDLTTDQIGEVVGVHLLGAFHVTQPAWRVMKERGYGRVVLTSSSSTFGHQANSNYAAAKAGVLGLTTALAAEGEERGIRVNAVLPYAVSQIAQDTPLVGADNTRIRAGLDALSYRRAPETVAPLVAFLASRACPHNGHAYSALAGRFARVFSGVTAGWLSADLTKLRAEDIGAHMDQIEELGDFTVPSAMVAEIELVLDQVQRLPHRS